MWESQHRGLEALERRGRLRSLMPRSGLDFSSNDYLGLAGSQVLRDAAAAALARGVSVGATGSRLLRGNDQEHEALEAEAAEFFCAESALFCSSGFAANQTLLSTLPAREDLIVADELAHASMREGMTASKAEAVTARHNDAQAFADQISKWRKKGGTGQVWLATESLFSMDGDRAPLNELLRVADEHGAAMVIDEAHATGVLGDNGRGLAAELEGRDNVITVHTCGKALGVMGALVLMPRIYRDFLINRARAVIYATAPSPLIAAIVRISLSHSASADRLRRNLQNLVAVLKGGVASIDGVTATGTHIQPIIVGREARAVAVSKTLIKAGFDVRAIRPPTVPEGTSRLRVSVTLNVTSDEVNAMARALRAALQEQAA